MAILEALCTAAARKVLDFNAQESSSTLWAMSKSGTRKPEVRMTTLF